MGTTDKIDLVLYRQYGLKDEAMFFPKAFLTQIFTVLHRLHNCLTGIPVAKLLLRHNVGIDINGILHPLMVQEL